jgi:hypothetical protein
MKTYRIAGRQLSVVSRRASSFVHAIEHLTPAGFCAANCNGPRTTDHGLKPLSLVSSLRFLRELLWNSGSASVRAEFANIGEGDFGHGRRSMLVDTGTAVLTSRYLLYKIGSDADHVTTCGLNDVAIGQSDDVGDANNADVPIAINLFGVCPGTLRVITDGTFANGDYVKAGASGQATKATTGDPGVFGRALFGTDTSANAGDTVTVVHDVPSKVSF